VGAAALHDDRQHRADEGFADAACADYAYHFSRWTFVQLKLHSPWRDGNLAESNNLGAFVH
jgi:hypothetical protein